MPNSSSPSLRQALRAADLWMMLVLLLMLWLVWQLLTVLLMVFAGLLFALAMCHAMAPLQRRFLLPPNLALLAVVLGLALLLGVGCWLMGAAAVEQLQALSDTLPRAWQALRGWVATFAPGRWLLGLLHPDTLKPEDWQQLVGMATGTLNAVLGALVSAIVIVVIGLYLAADPQTYQRGLLRLLPPSRRPLATSALDAAATALWRWLMGQGVSMLVIGTLTAIGLALAGVPLVVPLGVIAGVMEFVPYFGPFASGVLIVAVALTVDEHTALWAVVVCLAVQQAEAYLVQPLVQRWAVRLPPVLSILAVLIFGLLFGLPGALLAAPLMVLSMTLVEHLYVRAVVGDAPHLKPPAPVPPRPRHPAP
jgi:predicted PurR-regulated permease PerM